MPRICKLFTIMAMMSNLGLIRASTRSHVPTKETNCAKRSSASRITSDFIDQYWEIEAYNSLRTHGFEAQSLRELLHRDTPVSKARSVSNADELLKRASHMIDLSRVFISHVNGLDKLSAYPELLAKLSSGSSELSALMGAEYSDDDEASTVIDKSCVSLWLSVEELSDLWISYLQSRVQIYMQSHSVNLRELRAALTAVTGWMATGRLWVAKSSALSLVFPDLEKLVEEAERALTVTDKVTASDLFAVVRLIRDLHAVRKLVWPAVIGASQPVMKNLREAR